MTHREAPLCTARTESQGIGITGALDPAVTPLDAPAAPSSMGNGAHMGRGPTHADLPDGAVRELTDAIAEAIARGDDEGARELVEQAIRTRAGR